VIRSLIRLAYRRSVQPRWDGWLRRRDEPSRPQLQGHGGRTRLPDRTAYLIATGIVIVSSAMNTLTNAHDVSWRLGTPHNLWEPALWNATSGLVVISLLPLARLAATLIRSGARARIAAGLGITALAFVFSALHITGMGLLREFAYAFGGWSYNFPWSSQIPYELRKDLLAYAGLVAIFWLAERVGMEKTSTGPDSAEPLAGPQQVWLRDGRTSILIDTAEIVSVTSAGNYVEYRLTGARTHLIRATLQAQEDRLAPFGVIRVHRTRLVNLKRIVALEWRQSGDFEIRLDTGEAVSCSRRFKAAVAGLAA
jgi:LytTr DNA-binding domain